MNVFLPNRKLTKKEFLLIPEVFLNLLIARLKVSLLPSKRYIPYTSKNTENSGTIINIEYANNIAIIVNGISERTPWQSTCLVKVLALHMMLLKRKIPHILHFGIKKNTDSVLGAHAWLSVGEKIIIGGGNLQNFKEISQIEV